VDPGNSGGPIIALQGGRIVGIATAMAGGSKADRLNFATPMKDVCRILELLRDGVPPEAPVLEFSLLIDEDGRHSLQVGATHNAARWPFQPGDRIVSVGGEPEPVTTVTQFITRMRGRLGAIPIRVMRGGHELEILARPNRRPSVIAQRGVSIDGALIAPIALEDLTALSEPARLFVHSVEPGSAAEGLDMVPMDIIESIDGHGFDDLDSLLGYLRQHQAGAPLRIVFRRFGQSTNTWFEFHVRDLPGLEIQVI